MTDKNPSSNLFPAIGTVVDDTSNQNEHNDESARREAAEDDRGVQEVESLCMKCYKQVRRISLKSPVVTHGRS